MQKPIVWGGCHKRWNNKGTLHRNSFTHAIYLSAEVFVSEDFIRLDAHTVCCARFHVHSSLFCHCFTWRVGFSLFGSVAFSSPVALRRRIPRIASNDGGGDGGVTIAGDTNVSRTQPNDKQKEENIKLFVCARVYLWRRARARTFCMLDGLSYTMYARAAKVTREKSTTEKLNKLN